MILVNDSASTKSAWAVRVSQSLHRRQAVDAVGSTRGLENFEAKSSDSRVESNA